MKNDLSFHSSEIKWWQTKKCINLQQNPNWCLSGRSYRHNTNHMSAKLCAPVHYQPLILLTSKLLVFCAWWINWNNPSNRQIYIIKQIQALQANSKQKTKSLAKQREQVQTYFDFIRKTVVGHFKLLVVPGDDAVGAQFLVHSECSHLVLKCLSQLFPCLHRTSKTVSHCSNKTKISAVQEPMFNIQTVSIVSILLHVHQTTTQPPTTHFWSTSHDALKYLHV